MVFGTGNTPTTTKKTKSVGKKENQWENKPADAVDGDKHGDTK